MPIIRPTMKFLLSCLLLPLAAAAFADDTPVRLTPAQVQSMGIAIEPLSGFAASGGRRLPAQAVVPPRDIKVIAAPLSGLLSEVTVAYGETVRRGQLLARLHSAPLLELQREALRARDQARLAADTLERDRALFADGLIAAARLAAAEAAEREASAQWQEKRQALVLAGAAEPATAAGLDGTIALRAPFDGMVLEAAAAPGSRIDAAAPLFRLGRIDGLWIEIQATATQAAGLAAGDVIVVPGCAARGRLTLVAPAMNPASQSLLLRGELPRGSRCLAPFQYTQVEVVPARANVGWRVPNAALTRHQGQSWVFAESAEGFRPIAVRVLDESEKSSLIAGDLAADSRIVVRGLAALKAAWLGIGGGQ